MTPTLFYGVPSGCSFGSIVALEWLGAPYRLCRIDMPDVVSGEAYRRINPLGETPSLATGDGRFLSESIAILNHIAARGIDRGIGFAQGTPGFDRLNQVLAFLNTTFFSAFNPLWHVVEHGTEGDELQALRDYGAAGVRKAHAMLETMLEAGASEGPWLLGARRTVADAYFAGIARWTDYHQVIDRGDYPHLRRLHARLEEDPAVVFAHAIEHQAPARSSGGFEREVDLDEMLR